MIKIKSINDLGKKIISITEIQEFFKIDNYVNLVKVIENHVENGVISGVKNSGSNGRTPPLYNKYRVTLKAEDLTVFQKEINYSFPLNFSRYFYINNLKKYQADREYIDKLAYYFRHNKDQLLATMAINERSFEIWGQEKLLKEGHGQSILKNLGLSLEDLNVYLTPEPFVYYSRTKTKEQIVLIIENKDTWYTMRKLMIQGQASFLGEHVDTIIYGCGKNIEKSFEEYEHTVEEYLHNPAKIFYWGDIDYEGIAIYERLKKRYSGLLNIELYKSAYICMLDLATDRHLPEYSEKQNKKIDEVFFREMKPFKERILMLLERGCYIPQEIVNYNVLKEE